MATEHRRKLLHDGEYFGETREGCLPHRDDSAYRMSLSEESSCRRCVLVPCEVPSALLSLPWVSRPCFAGSAAPSGFEVGRVFKAMRRVEWAAVAW